MTNVGSKKYFYMLLLFALPLFSLSSAATAHSQCDGRVCATQSTDLLWFESNPENAAVWAPFGVTDNSAKSFRSWILKSGEQQGLPDFRNTLSLNCWEYILYVSLKFKTLSRAQVQNMVKARINGDTLSNLMGSEIGKIRYTMMNGKVTVIWPESADAGDVIFMDETSHVVQATGNRDAAGRMQVVSFSPRPVWGDGSAERPQKNVKPEVTTLESLIEELADLYPDVPTDWNNIDLKLVRLP